MWGLASFAFGAIDDELPNDQLFNRASKTRLNECEFQELENFSDLSVLTEEFDPGSD